MDSEGRKKSSNVVIRIKNLFYAFNPLFGESHTHTHCGQGGDTFALFWFRSPRRHSMFRDNNLFDYSIRSYDYESIVVCHLECVARFEARKMWLVAGSRLSDGSSNGRVAFHFFRACAGRFDHKKKRKSSPSSHTFPLSFFSHSISSTGVAE
jgi:hypothetical protein